MEGQKVSKNLRNESRVQNWSVTIDENSNVNIDQLNCGSMLRIADGIEKIASNYSSLIEERDRYKRWWQEEVNRNEKLHRRIRGFKGVITKLKKLPVITSIGVK